MLRVKTVEFGGKRSRWTQLEKTNIYPCFRQQRFVGPSGKISTRRIALSGGGGQRHPPSRNLEKWRSATLSDASHKTLTSLDITRVDWVRLKQILPVYKRGGINSGSRLINFSRLGWYGEDLGGRDKTHPHKRIDIKHQETWNLKLKFKSLRFEAEIQKLKLKSWNSKAWNSKAEIQKTWNLKLKFKGLNSRPKFRRKDKYKYKCEYKY